MPDNVTLSHIIPAAPEVVYAAWLDPTEHGRMTGTKASVDAEGGFTAGDGFISGRTLEEIAPDKVVQAWRARDFPKGAADSVLTVYFEPCEGGTRVTIQHAGLPAGQGERYREGWETHYLEPMTKYFASPLRRVEAVGDALGQAVEQAGQRINAAAQDALGAVEAARKKARGRAMETVEVARRARTRAVASARKVGKKVRALIQRKKKKPAAAKAPKAKAPAAKGAAPGKAATKGPATRKAATKKVAPAAKRKSPKSGAPPKRAPAAKAKKPSRPRSR